MFSMLGKWMSLLLTLSLRVSLSLPLPSPDNVLRCRIANPEKGLKTLLRRLGAIAASKDADAL